MTPAERAELREMERRWVDYLSAPSLGISDCRRELLEFLARHPGGEAAESEKRRVCFHCERPVGYVNFVAWNEHGRGICSQCAASDLP